MDDLFLDPAREMRLACAGVLLIPLAGCFHDSMGESLGPVTQSTTTQTDTSESTSDTSTSAGPTDPSDSDTSESTSDPTDTTETTTPTTAGCTPGEEGCMCDGSICNEGLECVDSLCKPEGEGFCGDGEVDPGESCDDGDDDDDDECHNDCRLPGELLWEDTHNGPANGIDAGFAVATASDGTIYAGGYESVTDLGRQALIRQYTAAGNEGWSKSFGVEMSNENDYVSGLATTVTDDLIAVGVQVGVNGHETFLRAYNPEGSELWAETRAATSARTFRAEDVAVAQDGSFVVVGSSFYQDSDNDGWVAVFNPEGQLQWEAFYFLGGSLEEGGFGVSLIDPSGQQGFISCGYATDPDNLDREVWLARYPIAGTMPTWSYYYTDQENIEDLAVDCEVVSGNALVLAQSGDEMDLRTLDLVDGNPVINPKVVAGVEPGGIAVAPDNSLVIAGTEGDDIWVRRYDSDGQEVWTTTHDGPASDEDFGTRVAVDPEGYVAAVGGVTNLTQGINLWLGRFAP